MTPRGTDWSLAVLIGALVLTGLLSWDGLAATSWIVPVHDALGLALAGVLVWKGRRVLGRLRPGAGAVAAGFVALTLASGIVWATAGSVSVAGFTLLAWHVALAFVLFLAVAVHILMRAKRPRRRDVTDRRQALIAGGMLALGAGVWALQRPLSPRAVTGSYRVASFSGNDFPVTSWVADDPEPLGARPRLSVSGHVRRPMTVDVEADDELVATLDCTGGFATTQRWSGARLDRLIERAGPGEGASHLRVVSVTGYRWAFPLDRADRLLLATHVGGEPLSHGHGAPLRLVAPGHRGWHWVKWVERVEVLDGPDPGAYLATLTSSL